MSELIIHFGEDLNGAWLWGLSGGDQDNDWGRAETSSEKQALAQLNASRIIAAVPGEWVGLRRHTIAGVSGARLLQAVTFAIEDEIADEIENTHIAPAGESYLAVIGKDKLQQIIDVFAEYGLVAQEAYADFQLIGDSLQIHDMRIINGQDLGYSVDISLRENIVSADVFLPEPNDDAAFLSLLHAGLHRQPVTDTAPAPINLLTREFTPANRASGPRWRRLGALSAGFAIICAAVPLAEGLILRQKTGAIQSEIAELYQQAFPEETVPDNPLLMTLQKAATEDDPGFAELSAMLTQSVQTVPGAKIGMSNYDGTKNALTISMNYSKFSDAQLLQQSIERLGGTFEDKGTRQDGDGVSGGAVISAGAR